MQSLAPSLCSLLLPSRPIISPSVLASDQKGSYQGRRLILVPSILSFYEREVYCLFALRQKGGFLPLMLPLILCLKAVKKVVHLPFFPPLKN